MFWNNKTLKLIQSNISIWANSFSHLFQEFLKEKTYPYKLVEIKYCAKKEKLLTVLQYAAKNIFIDFDLQELVTNNLIIEGLSPLDVRVATYYACMETTNPKFYIDALLYSEHHQEEVFHIVHHHTKSTEFKTAAEIAKQKSLIMQFSAEDAHKIGYIQGTQAALNERKELRELKQ